MCVCVLLNVSGAVCAWGCVCVIWCELVCEYNFRAVSYVETIQSPLITILLDTSHVMLAADVAVLPAVRIHYFRCIMRRAVDARAARDRARH